MKITHQLIKEVLNIDIGKDLLFDCLSMVNSNVANALSFIDQEEYLDQLAVNNNIKGVFVTKELASRISEQIIAIECEDPRYYFFTLMNYIDTKTYKKRPSLIHSSAQIHSRAFVSDYNVEIGENVLIEPNATILPDVVIGDNCIIRAGAVIGVQGPEYKRTVNGILHVFHCGRVILGKNVDVGANTVIDKGFSYRETIIGDDTKLNNLIYIAHGVQIGKRCIIIGCSMLSGSVTVQDDVWVGAAVTVSNSLSVGSKAFASIGSVVTKDIGEKEQVTGNFAINHEKFMKNLKKSLS
jgi:UDP-3-O-[3-hydroxymyristoyl] glucosamine N-acyltransferase